MVVSSANFIRDILFFVKNILATGITDPIASKRSGSSGWVMTSYPKELVQYPLITLKLKNYTATSSGMQTTVMDVSAFIEVRIWARDEKEKDTLSTLVYNKLKDIQFTTSTGSIANYLHFFKLLSATEIDEEGDEQPKSRILQINYRFYDV